MEAVSEIFENIFEYELPYFETELNAWTSNMSKLVKWFPDTDSFSEGSERADASARFERNREARKKCIAHYGTACQICGFDFGDKYGPSFAGMIEVHHIKPLSEIRGTYEVDPIHDLIPVCSNCHTAIHRRKESAYTPDEIRKALMDTELRVKKSSYDLKPGSYATISDNIDRALEEMGFDINW